MIQHPSNRFSFWIFFIFLLNTRNLAKSLAQLGGQFLGFSLLDLGKACCGLGTQDVASPVTADLLNKQGDFKNWFLLSKHHTSQNDLNFKNITPAVVAQG